MLWPNQGNASRFQQVASVAGDQNVTPQIAGSGNQVRGDQH
jgi:hypothetical protein